MSTSPSRAFARNRAEEMGFDLWGEFVVPLFFDKLALDEVRKPLLIEGGRGCGKTTLLRYLSHRTQLSHRRELSADTLPKQIGLYLRADTQYLRTFRGEWMGDEAAWQRVFEHSLCLIMLRELLSAYQHLSTGLDRRGLFPGIEHLRLDVLRSFDPEMPEDIEHAIAHLQVCENALSMWLNNPEQRAKPLLLPLRPVLLSAIAAARTQVPALAQVDFFVFVDEYENLLPYQMRLINTYLKHSEPPLIFHVAAKRNAMKIRQTIGDEQLQEPADFRRVDIEEYLAPDFELFAGELFCFRLMRQGLLRDQTPVSEQVLCDERAVSTRRLDRDYRQSIKQLVSQILPGLTSEQIAEYLFDDAALRERMFKAMEKTLVRIDNQLTADQFLRRDTAVASVCTLALLNQGKRPATVLDELAKHAAGQASRFSTGEWIHHYFLGTVLHLYLPLQRPCIAYAGFANFLKLARCNIRHFVELCHLSMQGQTEEDLVGTIRPEEQASAARSASALFVKETQGSGDHGNRIFQVVNTLGQIFRLSQQRPSQSEPERSHFSIATGAPSEEAETILRECVKWSVLFVAKETKVKDARFEADEYVLNPIYAPYFGISYNKGRRLELSQQAAEDMLTGDRQRLDELVRSFKRAWDVTESDQMPLL